MSKGKYAYEQALYFDEDTDESVFEDGCKYKKLYMDHKARKEARKTPKNFNEAAAQVLSQYDEDAKLGSDDDTFTIRRKNKLNLRHDRIRTAIEILNELEREFHHPGEAKSSDEYHDTVTGAAEEMKHTVHGMGLDMSNHDVKDIVDKISQMKSGTDIFKYLYGLTF